MAILKVPEELGLSSELMCVFLPRGGSTGREHVFVLASGLGSGVASPSECLATCSRLHLLTAQPSCAGLFFRALELMGGAGVAPPLRVGQEISNGFSDLSLLHGFRVWVTSTTFLPADK